MRHEGLARREIAQKISSVYLKKTDDFEISHLDPSVHRRRKKERIVSLLPTTDTQAAKEETSVVQRFIAICCPSQPTRFLQKVEVISVKHPVGWFLCLIQATNLYRIWTRASKSLQSSAFLLVCIDNTLSEWYSCIEPNGLVLFRRKIYGYILFRSAWAVSDQA